MTEKYNLKNLKSTVSHNLRSITKQSRNLTLTVNTKSNMLIQILVMLLVIWAGNAYDPFNNKNFILTSYFPSLLYVNQPH